MKRQNIFFLCCGIVMSVSEIWKQLTLTYIVHNGTYYWWCFPFQLCSIPMFVCLVLPFIHHTGTYHMLLAFLMDYALLSGIFTFLDTSGLHYSYTPLTIHSYLWHLLLITIGITAGITGKGRCLGIDFLHSTYFYIGACVVATFINIAVHPYGKIDMFYISPYYEMPQMIFHDISVSLGNIPAIFIYIAAIIAGAFLFHQMWNRISKIKVHV